MHAFYFIVSWTLYFKADYSHNWEEIQRYQRFEEQTQAIEFVKHAPDDYDQWECIEHGSGRHGYCQIAGIFPVKKQQNRRK